LTPPYRSCYETSNARPISPSCDLRYSGEVFGRFRPALQHLFARFAIIISGFGNWRMMDAWVRFAANR
jgi:hypothetical protein